MNDTARHTGIWLGAAVIAMGLLAGRLSLRGPDQATAGDVADVAASARAARRAAVAGGSGGSP